MGPTPVFILSYGSSNGQLHFDVAQVSYRFIFYSVSNKSGTTAYRSFGVLSRLLQNMINAPTDHGDKNPLLFFPVHEKGMNFYGTFLILKK
jgi:hypothetical protein